MIQQSSCGWLTKIPKIFKRPFKKKNLPSFECRRTLVPNTNRVPVNNNIIWERFQYTPGTSANPINLHGPTQNRPLNRNRKPVK